MLKESLHKVIFFIDRFNNSWYIKSDVQYVYAMMNVYDENCTYEQWWFGLPWFNSFWFQLYVPWSIKTINKVMRPLLLIQQWLAK